MTFSDVDGHFRQLKLFLIPYLGKYTQLICYSMFTHSPETWKACMVCNFNCHNETEELFKVTGCLLCRKSVNITSRDSF